MNKTLKLMCCTLAGLVLGCQQRAKVNQGGAAIKQVKNASELKSKIDAHQVIVVHALNAEHYAKGHVPGAINIDYEKMTSNMLPKNKDQAVVFYCAGPNCPVSDMAAHKAAQWGYTNVWVYKGGIQDWKVSGMPVATNN